MKNIDSVSITRSLFALVIALLITLGIPPKSEAQVLRVLAGNTFSGTLNGAMLGGASMALTNEFDNYRPLRVGVGMGTLVGMGIGAYDTGVNSGYVHGVFHSSRHSGYIILLDTFYGAATGSVAGMAIAMLGRDTRIIKGIQYGAGAGAWLGFAFGLVDGFYLSERDGAVDYFSDAHMRSLHEDYGTQSASAPTAGAGLITLQPGQYSIGLINPAVYSVPELQDLQLISRYGFGLELASFSLRF